MNTVDKYYKVGSESQLSEQNKLYDENTTTMDEKVAAVAGHEIEHATSAENRKLSGEAKENAPEAVETEILNQTPASNPTELKPMPVVTQPVEIKAPLIKT